MTTVRLRPGTTDSAFERADARLLFAQRRVHAAIDARHASEAAKTKVDHYVLAAWINAWYCDAMRQCINQSIDNRHRYGLPPIRRRIRVPALT